MSGQKMRPIRFYCETIEQLSILDPVESNHLSRVLRLSVGASVELFDGQGTLAKGIVEQVRRDEVTIRTIETTQCPPADTGNIILAVSFAKGQRFDWLVEKCTELGADHIAAVQFERTVKLGNAASLQRLSKITIAAAKQCGRICLPKLTGPKNLKETVAGLQADYSDCNFIYGSCDAKPLTGEQPFLLKRNVVVFIGPEGGFTEPEINYFKSLTASAVCINKNVLRIETAAIAFCSLLSGRQIFQ